MCVETVDMLMSTRGNDPIIVAWKKNASTLQTPESTTYNARKDGSSREWVAGINGWGV